MRKDRKMKKESNNKHMKSDDSLKKFLRIILSISLVLGIVALIMLLIFGWNTEKDENQNPIDIKSTVDEPIILSTNLVNANESTDITDGSVSKSVTLTDPSAYVREPQIPQELVDAVEGSGLSVNDLLCEQLVFVKSYNSTAKIQFFEMEDNAWQYLEEMDVNNAFVGSQGVSSEANEYSEYTPLGLFPLGTSFGIKENPGIDYPYFQITQDSYWVDDPESIYYNQHVEGTDNADWSSAEHLLDYQPSYNYAVEIAYNTNPIVSGKGSAFFVHVGSMPTAGCVAMQEQSVINMLQWLRKDKNPKILII